MYKLKIQKYCLTEMGYEFQKILFYSMFSIIGFYVYTWCFYACLH